MLKVCVLGAYGNIGSHALRYLYDTKKYKLYASGRDISKVSAEDLQYLDGVEWTNLDVNDEVALKNYIQDMDIVVNTVAFSSKNGHKIAKICIENNKKYIDAGMNEYLANMDISNSDVTCIYGAGALPGLSGVLSTYVAKDFTFIDSFKHITSLQGVFSKGSAYDYLDGVSNVDSSANLKKINKCYLPFIEEVSLNPYVDNETKYVANKIHLNDNANWYMAMKLGKFKSIIESSAIMFHSNPEEAVENLVKNSKLYNVKSDEHMIFMIEVFGTLSNGDKSFKTLILKSGNPSNLTGLVTGICADICADYTGNVGLLPFTQLADTVLYEKYLPYIVQRIQESSNTYIFDVYDCPLEDFNNDCLGEI